MTSKRAGKTPPFYIVIFLCLAAAVAPAAHRLEGDADVGFAVWLASLCWQATKPEVRCCGIANRPFAGLFGQFHQAYLLR